MANTKHSKLIWLNKGKLYLILFSQNGLRPYRLALAYNEQISEMVVQTGFVGSWSSPFDYSAICWKELKAVSSLSQPSCTVSITSRSGLKCSQYQTNRTRNHTFLFQVFKYFCKTRFSFLRVEDVTYGSSEYSFVEWPSVGFVPHLK